MGFLEWKKQTDKLSNGNLEITQLERKIIWTAWGFAFWSPAQQERCTRDVCEKCLLVSESKNKTTWKTTDIKSQLEVKLSQMQKVTI